MGVSRALGFIKGMEGLGKSLEPSLQSDSGALILPGCSGVQGLGLRVYGSCLAILSGIICPKS